MKYLEKIKGSKVFKKVIAIVCSASLAVSMVAVNAFAAESGSTGASGVDYSSMVTTITSAITEIITQIVNLATAILPLGLGVLGLMKLLELGKKFFTKATS